MIAIITLYGADQGLESLNQVVFEIYRTKDPTPIVALQKLKKRNLFNYIL